MHGMINYCQLLLRRGISWRRFINFCGGFHCESHLASFNALQEATIHFFLCVWEITEKLCRVIVHFQLSGIKGYHRDRHLGARFEMGHMYYWCLHWSFRVHRAVLTIESLVWPNLPVPVAVCFTYPSCMYWSILILSMCRFSLPPFRQ